MPQFENEKEGRSVDYLFSFLPKDTFREDNVIEMHMYG